MTVDVIVDTEGTFASLRDAFPAIHSEEPWWLPVNVSLLRTAEATILVDTGAGPKPRVFCPDGDARLVEELGKLGVALEDVDIVVHTHLHIDHVGWDGVFPNARYVVHEADWAYFTSESSLAERPHLREKVVPLERVECVAGDAEIAPGVRVEHTPGHTPGHLSVRTAEYAILGDLIVHELQAVDPFLVFVNDMDSDVAAATRRRVVAELADEGATVFAGHFFGRGRFEHAGKGFRWAVE